MLKKYNVIVWSIYQELTGMVYLWHNNAFISYILILENLKPNVHLAIYKKLHIAMYHTVKLDIVFLQLIVIY